MPRLRPLIRLAVCLAASALAFGAGTGARAADASDTEALAHRFAVIGHGFSDGGDKRLIGRADVPEHCGPVYEVPMSGAASVVAERFAIGAVTRLPEGGGAPVVERAVLMAPGQTAALLPGWVRLSC